MRGTYTALLRITGLNAAKTLLYITAPSNKNVRLLSSSVTNESNETNEQEICTWQKIGTLGTPTATTLTPTPHEAGDQAAASTVKGNVTASEPTYSSNTEVGIEGFSSLGGWYFDPTPEERPIIAGGASWGLRILNAPTSFDCVVSARFVEEG
jgi:hypothetical protein